MLERLRMWEKEEPQTCKATCSHEGGCLTAKNIDIGENELAEHTTVKGNMHFATLVKSSIKKSAKCSDLLVNFLVNLSETKY